MLSLYTGTPFWEADFFKIGIGIRLFASTEGATHLIDLHPQQLKPFLSWKRKKTLPHLEVIQQELV